MPTNWDYLKDATNPKVRVAKWEKEATMHEGELLKPKRPVQNNIVSQSFVRSKSTLLKERLKPSVLNTVIETEMPANQITRSEKLPSSSAQENPAKVGPPLKVNNSASPRKVRLPAQQTMELKSSHVEQKGKMQPRAQNVTLSQSYLAMKNEQVKLIAEKSSKSKSADTTFKKPVLGSFRGKIVKSKIQSFRSTSQQSEKREKSDAELQDTEPKVKLYKPRPKGVENVKPVGRKLIAMSHGKPRSLTATPGQHTLKNQRPSTTGINIKINVKPSANGDIAIVTTPASTAGTTNSSSYKAIKGTPARFPAQKLPKHSGYKPIKCTQLTDKRRTQPISKGKLSSQPEIMPLQKKSAEEPVKSVWTTIMEEENQNKFVNEINKSLTGCLKQIHEGSPSEDILQSLETLIECVPKAKKFARYWICLAYLEQRKGSVHDVMTIYEQAVRTGAQPAEELRNTLADILRNTKTPKKPCDVESKSEEDGAEQKPGLSVECLTEEKVELANDEPKTCVQENERSANDTKNLPPQKQDICSTAKDEHNISGAEVDSFGKVDPEANEKELSKKVEFAPKERLQEVGKIEGCQTQAEGHYESKGKIKNIKTEEMKTPVRQIITPSKVKERGSSVKYNVRATPKFQSAKNSVNQDACNSEIKDLKFLTPVRRSRRIEQVDFQLPLMLQDHDPCISSLDDLHNLGSDSTAFAFRMNDALQEYAYVSRTDE
ncbi:cytoskeleton-associated protein 2-like [Narcine bancroftii]|uniref:cytoskeleton-associated protein 2-like n=1 Tax=Narcine bancroftii TaxID=1343680 RepID=UPI0038310271